MAIKPRSAIKLLLATVLINSFLSLFLALNCFGKNSANLTIFSEPNILYALTEIARVYSKKNNTIVSINFDSPEELIQAIEIGEPADIFISSHSNWTEILKQKGLVDVYDLANIAKDKLLLVTSEKNHKLDEILSNKSYRNDKILVILNQQKIPLIIDSNYSSLGLYTNEIIKESDLGSHYTDYNDYIYKKVYEDKKSIIDFLGQNDQYCAIVMGSDIHDQNNVKVLMEIANVDIYYQALIVASDNMREARDFVQFLKSKEAKDILSKNNLIVD